MAPHKSIQIFSLVARFGVLALMALPAVWADGLEDAGAAVRVHDYRRAAALLQSLAKKKDAEA